MSISPIVLAGGAGSRLWPLSRASHPKQLAHLIGSQTMLQQTVGRLSGLVMHPLIVVCNEDHRFIVADQLQEVTEVGQIILEPEGKNTAPAVALAALMSDEDTVLLVLPADHVVQNLVEFTSAIERATPAAKAGKLVTFGVPPSTPHEGYGYIKKGDRYLDGYLVAKFVEKPSSVLADEYLASGDYCWNSGMFMFRAGTYLQELKKHSPEIYAVCCESVKQASHDGIFTRVSREAFKQCLSDSVDFAVMENTSKAVVFPINAGWSDVGSWSSLSDILEKDSMGNTVSGDVILNQTKNCLVRSDHSLVATLGVENLIIVSTKDAVLVAHKDFSEDVKELVNQVNSESYSQWKDHREVFRPWGKYDCIDEDTNFKVKRISVNVGGKLSTQRHKFRSEHWVVVKGTAKVLNGECTIILKQNESTYIPAGEKHYLENIGQELLEIIEVQTGSYFGEDDIERFDDIYGRLV